MEFTRRNSLIKKKQEQWAKEKKENDEKKSDGWFPFGENGSPGGGRPLRKHESLPSPHSQTGQSPSAYHEREQICSSAETSYSHSVLDKTAESHSNEEQMNCSTYAANTAAHNTMSMQFQYGMYPYPIPIPMISSMESSSSRSQMNQSSVYPYQYNFLPPGMVPVPIEVLKDSISHGQPICPASLLQNSYTHPPLWSGYNVPAGAIPFDPVTMTTQNGMPVQPSCSMSSLNETTMHKQNSEEDQSHNESYRQGSSSQMSESIDLSSRFNTSRQSRAGSVSLTTEEIEEQIQARRRNELEVREQEILAAQRAEREAMELSLREKRERERQEQEEEERRRILAQREAEIAAALERAKKEAESMRKARLFRHVVEGADNAAELLGVEGSAVKEVLQKVTTFEKQKKKELEEIERARPKDAKRKSVAKKSTDKQLKSPRKSQHVSIHEQDVSSPAPALSTPQRIYSGDRPIHPAKGGKFFDETDDSYISLGQSTPLSSSNIGRRSLRLPSSKSSSPSPRKALDDQNITYDENKEISPSEIPSTPKSHIPILERHIISPKSYSTKPLQFSSIGSTTYSYSQSDDQMAGPIPKPRTLVVSASSCDGENPLFSPIATRSRRMRTSTDAPSFTMTGTTGSLDSNDGTDSGTEETSPSHQQSPIPVVLVETPVEDRDDNSSIYDSPRIDERNNRLRSRSALSSPASYLNCGRQSPLCTSIYARKIAEKGCSDHNEDVLSPIIRKRAEDSLSRNGSCSSLRGSLSNLRASITNLNIENDELSPNIGKYRSMNPEYRSFNMGKKNSQRQLETLARLNKLREQIRSKENYMEKSPTMLSRHSSNQNIRH